MSVKDKLIDVVYWLVDETRELTTIIENIENKQVLSNKEREEIQIHSRNIEQLQKEINKIIDEE